MGPDELSEPADPEAGPAEPLPAGPPPAEPPPAGPPPAEPPPPELPPTEILKPSRAGRNLRAAIVVGLLMGGLALVTLFTIKIIFLIYVAAVIALGLWELTRA